MYAERLVSSLCIFIVLVCHKLFTSRKQTELLGSLSYELNYEYYFCHIILPGTELVKINTSDFHICSLNLVDE
jgi:hypothetical protein